MRLRVAAISVRALEDEVSTWLGRGIEIAGSAFTRRSAGVVAPTVPWPPVALVLRNIDPPYRPAGPIANDGVVKAPTIGGVGRRG